MKRKIFQFFISLFVSSLQIISLYAEGDDVQSSESQELPPVYTYIDVPVVEQRQVYTAEDIESEHFETLSDVLEGAGVQILSYCSGLCQSPQH